MELKKKYQLYIDKAKGLYSGDQTGHDFSHIERVLDYCLKINEEEGCDEEVVVVAALFHDVHRIMSNKKGCFVSAEESIEEVQNILSEFSIKKDKLNRILYAIKEHDNKALSENMPKELEILQDADILDSLGNVGLKRTLTYCKKHNIPIVEQSYSLDCKEYIPDVNPISTCHYIYRTMIPNAEFLHTRKGKEIGKGLTKVLKSFIKDKLIEEFGVKNNKKAF